jgi:ribosomal protein S27AE
VSAFRQPRKELAMSFIVSFNETCPKCHKTIVQATFEPHPSSRDIALQNFHCGDCGLVKTKIVGLKPGKSSPELAA